MKKIFIHHPSLDKELDSIFNLKEGFDNRDTNTLFKDLKDYFYEKGYSLSNSCGLNPNDADLILFYDISRSDPFFDRLKKEIKRKKLKTKLGVILFEPPIINKAQYSVSKLKYFDIVFTWKSDLVDNEKIFKYYWPEKFIGDPPFNRPFNNKKFICMVNANKLAVGKNELYSERKKAIKFFENTKEGIEVYGSGWNEKKLNFSVIGHIFLRCGFLLMSFICLDFKLFISISTYNKILISFDALVTATYNNLYAIS